MLNHTLSQNYNDLRIIREIQQTLRHKAQRRTIYKRTASAIAFGIVAVGAYWWLLPHAVIAMLGRQWL